MGFAKFNGLAVLLAASCSATLGFSQDQEPVVAATVDGKPVYVHEVKRDVKRVLKNRKVTPEALKTLQAKALSQHVDRQLILKYLAKKQQAPSKADIDLQIDRIRKRLQQQKLTLEKYLETAELSVEDLRRMLTWEKGWQGYLDRFLTDENLQKYFQQNLRHFDGSEVKVSHILLKAVDAKAVAAATEKANAIRQEITSKKISFVEAAQKYSDAPTGKDGGGIGFIQRHEPQPEAFSKAAFSLKKGEVSQPVISSFGVHLIQCQEIKPGQKRWQDVRGELEISVTQYLFNWVADRERPQAAIKFTEALPHFKPGTDELVP